MACFNVVSSTQYSLSILPWVGCTRTEAHGEMCFYHYPAFSSPPPTKTTHLFQTSIDRPDRHGTAHLLINSNIRVKTPTFSFTHHLSNQLDPPSLPGHRRHLKVIQERLIEAIPKKAFSFSLLHLLPPHRLVLVTGKPCQ